LDGEIDKERGRGRGGDNDDYELQIYELRITNYELRIVNDESEGGMDDRSDFGDGGPGTCSQLILYFGRRTRALRMTVRIYDSLRHKFMDH
jgi:hypothetical protein